MKQKLRNRNIARSRLNLARMKLAIASSLTFALREWRDTSAVLKWLFFWSLSLGIVLTIICVAADIKGNWDRLPFLTNLMSNMAGALFGLPLALVILSRLSAYQTERANRLRIERLLVKAVKNLEGDVHRLITPRERDDESGFYRRFKELSELETRLLREVESSSTIGGQHDRLQPNSPLQVAAKEYAEARSGLCYRLHALLGKTSLRDFDTWRNTVRIRWRYIDQVIRHQHYEFDTAWPISTDSENSMAKAVALKLIPSTLLQLADQAHQEIGQLDLYTEPDPKRESLDYILDMITSETNAKAAMQELSELSELFYALHSVAFDIVEFKNLADSSSPDEIAFAERYSMPPSLVDSSRTSFD